jgi:2-polyprenylphenol 6-hydroxylase
MVPQQFDVAIVGAGLAGTALAAALGGSELRVALLEAQPLALEWPALADSVASFDSRVSALTATSRAWLDQLGAWPLVAAQRLAAYKHMQVWDGEGTGSIGFEAAAVNEPVLGHIVENRLLQTALLQCVARHRNVQVFNPVQVTAFARTADRLEISLENGRTLQAELLVAADGANSKVREWAGFRLREWDYGQQALVATVATELPHRQIARQIFRREGPLAFLPLPDSKDSQRFCSIVWSTTPDEAQSLLAADDTGFRTRLGQAFEHRLGAIAETSRRFAFPLRARHAEDYVAPGIALIGDAAHTIHPLAGQGINLGLLDAQVLAAEIRRATGRGLRASEPTALARYQRQRKGDNIATLAAMEGFKRLFGATGLPVRLLRNRGLQWVDRSAPLKRLLIRQAMGLSA